MSHMARWEVRFARPTVKWDWPVETALIPDSMVVRANSAAHAAGTIRSRYPGAVVHCTLPVGVL